MILDSQHFFWRKLATFTSQRPETAVALMPPGASGNLRHFCDRQPPPSRPVEFRKADKGDMRNIKVEAHTDSIGGH